MAKKQNGQISTKLVYLDFSVILANYRDPQFWGKQWTIYKSGNIEIYWMMTNIHVKHQTIKSEVHMRNFTYRSGKYKASWADEGWFSTYEECQDIPIANPEYTQKTFEKNILGSVLRLIELVENHLIRGYAEYKKAAALEKENEETLRGIAETIADEYVVSGGEYSDTIKEAFVEKYVDDNTEDYTGEVLTKYSHKVLGSLYLMVCSWFGNRQRFEEQRKLMGDNKKEHIWSELFSKARELQSKEWRNAMAEDLKNSI